MKSQTALPKTILMSLLTLAAVTGLTSCSFEFSAGTPSADKPSETEPATEPAATSDAPGLKEVKLCDNEDGCDQELTTVSTDLPEMYVLGNMGSLPEGSMVTGKMIYLEGPVGENIEVVSTEVEKKPLLNVFTFTFSAPNDGWPQGKYEVILSSDAAAVEPVSKFFVVE
jgi:hypothetical protein